MRWTVVLSQPKKPLPGAKKLTPAEEQAAIAAAKEEADYNPQPWRNNNVWDNQIVSFTVNGEPWHNRERIYAFLHHYSSGSAHTKCHMMGNSLSDRILTDSRVTKKLSESRWTTTALHHGLQYGTQGPLTHPRLGLIPVLIARRDEAHLVPGAGRMKHITSPAGPRATHQSRDRSIDTVRLVSLQTCSFACL